MKDKVAVIQHNIVTDGCTELLYHMSRMLVLYLRAQQ